MMKISTTIDSKNRGYANHRFTIGWNDNRYSLFEESGISWEFPGVDNQYTIEIIDNIHDNANLN